MQMTTKLSYASATDPLPKRVLIRSIEHVTGQRKLEQIYSSVLDCANENCTFWEAALRGLQIEVDYSSMQLAKTPAHGPLILIANHPFGLIDGLVTCHLASLLRPDFKILIHRALCGEPRIAPYVLPIDFTESEEATLTNIESKQRALETLRQNGAIIIFPGGGIATTRGPFGKAIDLEWKLFVTKLIQMSRATILPLYFHGQNSRLFQVVSQFSMTLRLALIIHEVNNKIGDTIRVTIGNPILYEEIATIKRRKDLLDYLRNTIYGLSPTQIPHQVPPLLPCDRRKKRAESAALY